MSDTPRTDKAEAFDDDGRVVSASFARTLERELAEYQRTEPLKLAERNGLLRELAEYQRPCRWTENDDGAWEASCGEIFEFTDGGPKENKFKHCPYCGRRLENTKPSGGLPSAPANGSAGESK